MQRNTLMFVLAGVAVFVGGYFVMTKSATNDSMTVPPETLAPMHTATEGMPADMPDMEMPTNGTAPEMMVNNVKEFTMTAYYDEKGKWFSLKEMTVKKGDTVRVNITNTKGMHDFSLDEYGIKKTLPLNETVVVDFVADKAGDFVYYCSMPGHRAGGQWGTLHVTE